MHQLLFLLAFCLALQTAHAQKINLTGTVSDSASAKTLPGVSVSLLADGREKLAVKTGDNGQFSFSQLAAGEYTVRLSAVGYLGKIIPLTLSDANRHHHLGSIVLSAETKNLEGITVTAQKALIEDKGDRLVYNADRDISNAGGTAADVLRKVPAITVDLNGNVQMRGNSNIRVLVNGKPSAMMARNLADALRQMPANVIKSVEVITSPGAKYDAEGAAGVINIITKKGLQGFNGSVNATAGDRNRSIGTSISIKTPKIGLNFSGNLYQYRNTFENSSVRTTLAGGQPLNILYRSSAADNIGMGGYGELAFDYDPDSTNHLNLSGNAWGGNYPNNATTFLKLTDPAGGVLQDFRNEVRFRNPYGNGQLDFGWTKTFKKPEQEFSFLTQISRMPDNYFYNTDRIAGDRIIFREKSTNYSRNMEYTVQADFTQPISLYGKKDTSTLKLELGTKAIIRDIGSEVRVEQALNGSDKLVPDPSQSNDFAYIQRVYSGYTSLRWSNKQKWNLNAGARLERTEIKGDFITTATKINNQYSNLIPSFTLSKGIDRSTFKLSYTQRITRPLIWFLNPWVNRSDPKNISTGTPDLDPELNHATEISHSINTAKSLTLNTAVYWRMTDNAIEYVTRMGADGVSTSQPLNIARRSALGINANVSSKPNKNWNLNGGADLRHIDVSSPAMQQQNSGWVWNLNMNTTYKLPKEYTVQAFGSVNSGWLSLQRTPANIGYWYGLSGKKTFWEQKGSLTLGINNPFAEGLRQRVTESAPSFTANNEFFFVNRSFRLTFEWRFGQMSAGGGKKGKKITNDDSSR